MLHPQTNLEFPGDKTNNHNFIERPPSNGFLSIVERNSFLLHSDTFAAEMQWGACAYGMFSLFSVDVRSIAHQPHS